jgi:hypothetical protein
MKVLKLLYTILPLLFVSIGTALPEILEGARIDPDFVTDMGLTFAMAGGVIPRTPGSKALRGSEESVYLFLDSEKGDAASYKDKENRLKTLGAKGNGEGPQPIFMESGDLETSSRTLIVQPNEFEAQDRSATISFDQLTFDLDASDAGDFIEGGTVNSTPAVSYLSVVGDSSNSNSPRLFIHETEPDAVSDMEGVLPSGFDVYRNIGIVPIVGGNTDLQSLQFPAFSVAGNEMRFFGNEAFFLETALEDAGTNNYVKAPRHGTGNEPVKRIASFELVLQFDNDSADPQKVQIGPNNATITVQGGANHELVERTGTIARSGRVNITNLSELTTTQKVGVTAIVFNVAPLQ